MKSGGSAGTWQQNEVEEEEEEEAQLSGWQLVRLAETHLRLRNFSVCREYALESLSLGESDNKLHREAIQIVAISNILSSPSDYYSILQVDTFCSDVTLIRSKFKQLLSIVEPIKNNSQVANEAANLLWKAFACLSDPLTKSQFDNSFSSIHTTTSSSSCFWSFCPYCLYVYQYSRVYEGCCLRCPNHSCRRAFHGLPLNSDSLPSTTTNCYAYFPLGFSPSHPNNNFHSWSPFVGMLPVTPTTIPNTNTNTNTTTPLDLNNNHSDHSDNDPRPVKHKSLRSINSNLPNDFDHDMAFFEEGGEIFVDLTTSHAPPL